MWGWDPSALERIQANTQSTDPVAVEDAKAKREAEKKVEESGVGECIFCNEEIVKNEREVWESDFLLEYCVSARDHRHKPKITWKAINEQL